MHRLVFSLLFVGVIAMANAADACSRCSRACCQPACSVCCNDCATPCASTCCRTTYKRVVNCVPVTVYKRVVTRDCNGCRQVCRVPCTKYVRQVCRVPVTTCCAAPAPACGCASACDPCSTGRTSIVSRVTAKLSSRQCCN